MLGGEWHSAGPPAPNGHLSRMFSTLGTEVEHAFYIS